MKRLSAVLILLMLTGSSFAQEARKVALVIGNSAYENGPLQNPVNDADAVEKSLSRLGFEVTKRKNLNLREMKSAVSNITDGLKETDVCAFFFAGHGMQVKGVNYLVPLKVDIKKEADVPYECLALDRVISNLEDSDCGVKIVILDCCRNNPLARTFRRSGSKGLSAIAGQPDGMIIAFSTKPGQTALDGDGQNSPYTKSLISVLDSRPAEGLKLFDTFILTARSVAAQSGQRPFLRLDAAMQDVFLAAPIVADAIVDTDAKALKKEKEANIKALQEKEAMLKQRLMEAQRKEREAKKLRQPDSVDSSPEMKVKDDANDDKDENDDPIPAGTSKMRKWNDKSGKFSVEAKFVKKDGSNVVLEKTNGSEMRIPISKLSEEDREYLDKLEEEDQ